MINKSQAFTNTNLQFSKDYRISSNDYRKIYTLCQRQARQKYNTHKLIYRFRNGIFETILNISISVTLDTLLDIHARKIGC